MIGCCSKVSRNGLKFGKKSEQKKNNLLVSGTLRVIMHRHPGYRELELPSFPDTDRYHSSLVSQIPGSCDYLVSWYHGAVTIGSGTPWSCFSSVFRLYSKLQAVPTDFKATTFIKSSQNPLFAVQNTFDSCYKKILT